MNEMLNKLKQANSKRTLNWMISSKPQTNFYKTLTEFITKIKEYNWNELH